MCILSSVTWLIKIESIQFFLPSEIFVKTSITRNNEFPYVTNILGIYNGTHKP